MDAGDYKIDEEQFGQQIWGLGYISTDWEHDDDDPDELDEDENTEECLIAQKVLDGKELELHEMETVSDSIRLRDVYNHRWWNQETEAHFTMYNYTREPLKPGKQVTFIYGNRSNEFLVEK